MAPKEDYVAPDFLELPHGDGVAAVPFEEAIANPEMSAQVTRTALLEVEDWARSYAAFFQRIGDSGALEIVDAIEQLKGKMGSHWPTSGDDGEGEGMLIDDDDA